MLMLGRLTSIKRPSMLCCDALTSTVVCISSTGAIAGIADQPLQSLTSTGNTPKSPGRHATGIVSGVGKGLVGAFTKPIGGAAELVSQTGMGLLHGAGLTSIPSPRHAAVKEQNSGAVNTNLKFIQ